MNVSPADKDVMQDSTKYFIYVQIDDISCSSLTHQCCNAIVEGHRICQAQLALGGVMLSVTSHLIFYVP